MNSETFQRRLKIFREQQAAKARKKEERLARKPAKVPHGPGRPRRTERSVPTQKAVSIPKSKPIKAPTPPAPSAQRWAVYALTDPATGGVRYVGITTELQSRIRAHLLVGADDGTPKAKWVRSLRCKGMIPGVLVLQSGVGMGAAEAERRWIHRFRKRVADLLNVSSGGYSLGAERKKKNPSPVLRPAKPCPPEIEMPLIALFDLRRSFDELLERANRGRKPEERKIEFTQNIVPIWKIRQLNQILAEWPMESRGVVFGPFLGEDAEVYDAR